MNFVGPRPVRPVFLQEFITTIPDYARRFEMKPGITGVAQLRGGYFTTPAAKLRYELWYRRVRRPTLDLSILILTFVKILNRWIKPDGSFRSRQLLIGWDDVPMHRWGQAQMFRSLAFYLREETRRLEMQHVEHHARPPQSRES